ncbi:hypothetical protein GF389_04145 [Candidatus Dojkabacteria bacterium]|nr:hypothetical protein [Candidatus Dojkabacteria bacterium]
MNLKMNLLPKGEPKLPETKLKKLANKAEFSAGLSHEIATPLTCIKTNLEIIKTRQSPNEFVEGALIGLKQIDLIINNYLHLNKQQKLKLSFNPNKEIMKAIELLTFKLRKNNVKVRFDLRARELYGNPTEFSQVVANLISNSCDAYDEINQFTGKGLRRIEIISRIIGGAYVLKVADYGTGIPKKNQKKIFESYFTTKGIDSGTGLGLAVSKEIVEQNFQGSLELSSRQDPTIFTIKIPFGEK